MATFPPLLGKRVIYFPSSTERLGQVSTDPLAGLVVRDMGKTVSIVVFRENGSSSTRLDVPVYGPEDTVPPAGGFCVEAP